MNSRVLNRSFRWLAFILAGSVAIDLGVRLLAEIFWFQELGYLNLLKVRLITQARGFAIVTLSSAFFLLTNLVLAQKLRHRTETEQDNGDHQPAREIFSLYPLTFRWLLPISLLLGLTIGMILLHYGKIAAAAWQPQLGFSIPPTPPQLSWQSMRQLVSVLPVQSAIFWLQWGVLLTGTIVLLIFPNPVLWGSAIGLSVSFGLVCASQWSRILQFLHPTLFHRADPLFGLDIGFYIFRLPVLDILAFWLLGISLFGLVAVTLTYLTSGNSLSQGKFLGFSQAQYRHLAGLAGCWLLAIALRYWLNRYELLYSTRGVAYGASYTDFWVELPAYKLLNLLAVLVAFFLFGYAALSPTRKLAQFIHRPHRPFHSLLPWACLLWVAISMTAALLSTAVQRFAVQPNELERERPYIRRAIALTREAFALEDIEVKTFEPKDRLTDRTIQQNNLTIRNIRLWDTRPLLQTNRQLQQIRPYYRFPGADIDRYTLKSEVPQVEKATPSLDHNSTLVEKQQVLIAARELDYQTVPKAAQTWVNERLIYTHGYGFTLSPVNKVAPGGLPDYFVKDIGIEPKNGDLGGLRTSSDRIRASIPIGHPRIYYGELANTNVLVGTRQPELDYPSGRDNVYNTYAGRGGVSVASFWQRGLYALYLRDGHLLWSQDLTRQTRLLFRRNLQRRVQAIAPFLHYDSDPYLVVADIDAGEQREARTGEPKLKSQNNLYWMLDAYTTSDRYPYSDPGNDAFNYIRNSVKVVIDAYHGSVNFYIADPQDPILASWAKIFPNVFKPLDALPKALRTHIRYPVDLFSIQSERLLTYHMTDPQVFYNREDQWQIPQEIYGSKSQTVEPYYLITKLPTEKSEEFILLLPFTPTQRPNLVAWLAARSDGNNYGKLLLYQFPKQQLIYGTEQIEARINQDPVISQQISLWNREGSRAVQGNLLVIPIEQSLLYVEPLYLEAEQNSLPTLVRVIVAYENRIAMAETLEKALQSVFQTAPQTAPAIVRSVNP
ncbi:MAG: UPF0182 family protein [Scytolyngbya sp. HA4215-MV1]|jgi:hypothetical protein|nr:UPF0182 family protein [Scytolyngbya sp. HA4215-MV1]